MQHESVSKLFRQEVKFVAGAASIAQLPKLLLPEVAFIGKSNVGKSSLINIVCNRKSLARVSHTPGRTQQINFFSLAEKITLVDLPGYGFAKVSDKTKERWEKLIIYYLEKRENLKLINVLVDSRRGLKDHDIEVLNFLHAAGRNFQIVFTKVDEIKSREELDEQCKNFLASLNHYCNVIYTSSRSKEGARELQSSLAKCIK